MFGLDHLNGLGNNNTDFVEREKLVSLAQMDNLQMVGTVGDEIDICMLSRDGNYWLANNER